MASWNALATASMAAFGTGSAWLLPNVISPDAAAPGDAVPPLEQAGRDEQQLGILRQHVDPRRGVAMRLHEIESVVALVSNAICIAAEHGVRHGLRQDRSGDAIGEPVIGAGGLHPPPEGYWPAIADLCREHDVLLIADEVISGFGRLGSWFGCQNYGFEPDLITVAKGLTSGYLPLGAVIASPRVAEPFWSGSEAPMFRHGYTYAGHPAACAAARISPVNPFARNGAVT